jgi:uncharacterized protein (TIGR02466 family)
MSIHGMDEMKQLTELRPFFTSIFAVEIDADLESIKNGLYKMKDSNAGRTVSNMGGWQSEDIEYPRDNLPNSHFLSPLIQQVEAAANAVYSTYKVDADRSTVTNCWANINGKHNFNMLHNHPFSYFSACYYVKVPKDSGDIVFQRPDLLRDYVPFSEDMEYNYGTYFLKPQEKMLVIFPSMLNHMVYSNLTEDEDSDRISIAFNLQ